MLLLTVLSSSYSIKTILEFLKVIEIPLNRVETHLYTKLFLKSTITEFISFGSEGTEEAEDEAEEEEDEM